MGGVNSKLSREAESIGEEIKRLRETIEQREAGAEERSRDLDAAYYRFVRWSVTPVRVPQLILATVRSLTEINDRHTSFECLFCYFAISSVCSSICHMFSTIFNKRGDSLDASLPGRAC